MFAKSEEKETEKKSEANIIIEKEASCSGENRTGKRKEKRQTAGEKQNGKKSTEEKKRR